jgi:glycosyltransferase involved in cell wall biosynthesis
MASTKVSILMATWNRAGLLGAAIRSVLEQSFKDWELIISDDGSTDDTPEVVRNWQKKEARIVYARSEKNEGISKNYNKGLRIARGEYVAMIDDDDPWCDKNKLRKQIEFLDKNRDYVGCGGGVIVVDKDKKPARHASRGDAGRELYRYLKPETDAEIRKYMLFSNPMANSTTIFRRDVAERLGWYDETTRYSGDRDFWLKMGTVGKLYNFREHFSYYTMSGENTSIAKLRPHLKASLMIMRRYKKNYPHYWPALLFNLVQYWYAFLPIFIRKPIHKTLARLKRVVVK